MDTFADMLKEVRQHLSAGRGARAWALLDEALALERSEPPTEARAFTLGQFASNLLPNDQVPLLARTVEMSWERGAPDSARFWTEHLVNAAVAAGTAEPAAAAVRRLLAEGALSPGHRRLAEAWEKKLARLAERPAAKAVPARPAGKVGKAGAAKKGAEKAGGNVARWLARTRGMVKRLAREEDVDSDELAEVLDNLDDLAKDLRRLGGDRGSHVLDDLEDVEDAQKSLRVASGENDARARVEGLAELDEEASFADVRALVEPTEW